MTTEIYNLSNPAYVKDVVSPLPSIKMPIYKPKKTNQYSDQVKKQMRIKKSSKPEVWNGMIIQNADIANSFS